MTTTSLNDYWNKPPKVDGSLGDDGDYFVTFVKVESRSISEGTGGLIEFSFTANEGEAQGESSKTPIFYLKDGKPNFNGLDRLKAVSDMVDPAIREAKDFDDSLNALKTLVPGLTGKVRQNTSKGRVYFDILEIDPAAPPVPDQKQSKGSELLTESDIPF